MLFIWTLLIWYITTTDAQNCNYYTSINSTARVPVASPGYPVNYTGDLQCRWILDCPEGYNCRLDCPEISLPPAKSSRCVVDQLLVSKSGDPQLTGADVYCGRGTLAVLSTRQRISIGLVTSTNTPGGRFLCMASAQRAVPSANCTCGMRRQNRIVGGQETGVNEFPMMVGLVDTRISKIICGGDIISNTYVLTAAHCLKSLEKATTAVIVGEHDITKGESPATKGYRVSKFIPHTLYSDVGGILDYDIGLVATATKMVFSDRVGPVCLPFKFLNNDFAGEQVTVLGWGTSFFGGPDSDTLQKVDVTVLSDRECRDRESSATYRQMCTYTPGKDSCQEDSGGPLLYTDPSTGRLFAAGIVSSGRSCASRQPAINTRVTSFLNWIVENTRETYCRK